MFNGDIIPIKLVVNADIIELLKNKLPENLTTSIMDNYTGYLKIQYKVKNKNSSFKSLYYVNFDKTNVDFDELVEKLNNEKIIEKQSFDKSLNKILFSSTFQKTKIISGDKVTEEILSKDRPLKMNYFITSTQSNEDYKIINDDKLYNFYAKFDKDDDDYNNLTDKEAIYINVDGSDGNANIKGFSIYDNSTCEIYRIT